MNASNATQKSIRELVKGAMEEGGYSQRDLAKGTNYSTGTISSWLAGKYGAGSAKVEAALLGWLRRKGVDLAADGAPSRIIDTRVIAAVGAACTTAQEQGVIAAVIGAPGMGKTLGLEAWTTWARREEVRHILITASIATTAAAIIRQLATALGLGRGGTMAQQLDLIVERLNREPSVILIDEAQHLGVRALEAVRAVHDASRTGVVFCGSLALCRTLEEGDGLAIELAQLQDRVAVLEKLPPLTPLEVAGFVKKWLGGSVEDEGALEEIRRISRGIPRRLDRLLGLCQSMGNGKAISPALVREAAKRLVVQ